MGLSYATTNLVLVNFVIMKPEKLVQTTKSQLLSSKQQQQQQQKQHIEPKKIILDQESHRNTLQTERRSGNGSGRCRGDYPKDQKTFKNNKLFIFNVCLRRMS